MRSAESRIKDAAQRMKATYTREDAAGFLEAAQALRDISAQALDLGILTDAVNALERLKKGLELVNGFIPERDGLLSSLSQCSAEFIEAVMPAFSVNGFEVINNIGVSNQIDEYLFAEKIRVDQLNGGDQSYQLLFWCLRQNRQSHYIEGLEVVVDELLARQKEVMCHKDYQTSLFNARDNMVQYGFFLHMRDVVKDQIDLPALSPRLDEKLAQVLTNLNHGDSLSISSRVLEVLISSGLHKSAGAAILNANSVAGVAINIDLLKDPSDEVVVHTFLLGCQHKSSPDLIKHMVNFDAEDVLELLKGFVSKRFNFNSGAAIQSCVDFMATDDYQPSHQDLILALLEAASLRIQRDLRQGQLDYEVIRETMSRLGVPEHLQFKIGTIRKNRGKILELSLGF